MRRIVISAAALMLAACSQAVQPDTEQVQAAPDPAPEVWTFEDGSVFPADKSLQRPESGIVLPDGTLVVVHQSSGLVALAPDGSHQPFGKFADAGFVHAPPAASAGPNGVSLEPDGQHLLVADIFSGGLYRTDIAAGTTVKIYQHPFGINYARKDSTGAIWFSQSTENAPPESESRMYAAVNGRLQDGALFRIAPAEDGMPLPAPERKISGLNFANGFVIDETRGELFLSETMGQQVLGYKLDVATGTLTDRRIVAEVLSPDNIEQDDDGLLWVASPISNELIQINPDTGETRVVFHPQTDASDAVIAEFHRRRKAGEDAMLDLLGPDVWGPMPGMMTGVILTPGGGPVYLSGLGDALLKIDAARPSGP